MHNKTNLTPSTEANNMAYNELRKDYFLDRWVVIATQRARRPTDSARTQKPPQTQTTTYPMCPSNEHMTPPAVLVYLKKDKAIRKTKDKDDARQKDWLVRARKKTQMLKMPARSHL